VASGLASSERPRLHAGPRRFVSEPLDPGLGSADAHDASARCADGAGIRRQHLPSCDRHAGLLRSSATAGRGPHSALSGHARHHTLL
jgi:hypothetical protein